MDILVCGATGFVARHLISSLANAGHRVYAAGHDSSRLQRLTGATPVVWDLAQLRLPPGLPDQVDAAVHLAQANVPFPDHAPAMFEVNAASVVRALDYARRAGATRFVLASSGSVYGGGERPWREDDPTNGQDFYAATKLAAERVVLAYTPYLGTTILRLFAPYGPGQTGRLVPGLIDRVRSGQPVTLKEGRGPRFNPLYVDHVVDIIAQTLAADGHQVLNAGGDEVLSVRDMAETVGRLLGRRPVFQDVPGAIGGDVVGDLTRLRQAFRLPAQLTTFAEGVRRMMDSAARQAPLATHDLESGAGSREVMEEDGEAPRPATPTGGHC
jgi:nucleoside-diphosphate-sugar epimerase